MAESLAVKYRPQTLDAVVSQNSIVKILTRQLEREEFCNAYLFCGSSGTGKTTCARAFANAINKGQGSPIEIDAASNSGVDNVRIIIKDAQERALDAKYKIFVIDECHSLSSQAWQAFLKCIEEPPTYTIFIFCTTDPQKIPDTIKNRVQQYRFNRIPFEKIRDRLVYICNQEGFINYDEAVDYIAKISEGGMRTAIAYLEKCASYNKNLEINHVLDTLGNYSYDTFFGLVNNMIDGNEAPVLDIISNLYNDGHDLKLFVDQFLNFCLDVNKYALFKSVDVTHIPTSMENKLQIVTNFDNASRYYNYILDKLLILKMNLKNDNTPRSTIEISFLQITRCM